MNLIIPVLVLLILCGCNSPPPALPVIEPRPVPPPTYPRHPLWAMRPKTWQKYWIYRGPGKFNRATNIIEFDVFNMVAGETNRNTNLEFMSAAGPSIARIYSPQGVVVDQVSDTLDAALAERAYLGFIGESANYLHKDQDPPQPILPFDAFVGQVIDVISLITRWDGTTFWFSSKCVVTAVGVDILGFTGCTITTHIENPDKSGLETVYCQAFDGEMAVQWYGWVKPDDSVDLILAVRVAQGENP